MALEVLAKYRIDDAARFREMSRLVRGLERKGELSFHEYLDGEPDSWAKFKLIEIYEEALENVRKRNGH